MEIPVYEKGGQVGTLQIVSQGLYTTFQTRLPAGGSAGADLSGRQTAAPPGNREAEPSADHALTRLWLIGKCGAAAALGLLRQEADGRSFCRKLSRTECGRLPKHPVMALVLPNGEKPGKPAGSGRNGAPRTPSHTEETRVPESGMANSDACWRPLSDGSLVDPGRRLLALPWGGGAVEPPARKISLGERDYLLFRY